jgi:hypothetical protein
VRCVAADSDATNHPRIASPEKLATRTPKHFRNPGARRIDRFTLRRVMGLSGLGAWRPIVAEPFTPIYTGEFSQSSFDVSEKLRGIPTLTELTARLGALPREALAAATAAEPAIYKRTIADAQDSAAYLRLLADGFDKIAGRLASVS